MALLDVAGEVVLAAEPLGAILAQEVLASRMHDQVATHVLAGVETPLAVFTLMTFLFRGGGTFPGVAAQVLQQQGGARVRLQTHLTRQVSAVGGVQGLMPSEAQLGIVALATFRAAEGFFVGVVRVEVILQMVLTMEHLLAVAALVCLVWRVCGHVPADTNTHWC